MSNLTNFLDDFTFEKPILFSTLMVQAILEGRKTQTRRVIKCDFYVENDPPLTAYIPDYITGEPQPVKLPCPYGQISDRLWVRETFAYHHTGQLFYKTDIPVLCHKNWKWKPSIFMPRTASRIDGDITNIRVERVSSISEADAIAEGIKLDPDLPYCMDWSQHPAWFDYINGGYNLYPIQSYKSLWNSINNIPKPIKSEGIVTSYIVYPFDEQSAVKWQSKIYKNKPLIVVVDPYVWVIEFKRIEK
jgi:hypothetical protein